MSDHPSVETVDRYRRGTLPPEQLLAVDAHLEDCAACRAAVQASQGSVLAWQALASAPGDHLSYDQMAMFVDRTLDAVGLELVEAHVRDCQTCAAEVGDLRVFQVSLSQARQASVPRGHVLWRLFQATPVRIALSSAAAALLIWLVIPGATPPSAPESPSVPAPVRTDTVASLLDGGRRITLDSAGRVQGLGPIADGDLGSVTRALSSGRLDVGVDRATLTPEPGTLLGPARAEAPFGVIEPAGTVVESDRPAFRWREQPGATGYVVAVYDERFTLVLESPTIAGTSWQGSRQLERGRLYRWQVKARTSTGAVVTAPVPPAPEARFTIVAAKVAADLARARALQPPSRLWLAALYADAGMIGDAERELRVLESENPSSPLVASLIASLRQPK